MVVKTGVKENMQKKKTEKKSKYKLRHSTESFKHSTSKNARITCWKTAGRASNAFTLRQEFQCQMS